MTSGNSIDASNGPILLIGASVRAAACSARRAGFTPLAADLFADTDLARIAQTRRIADYPQGFLDVSKQAPECPCAYTGGLENFPELLDEIASHRPLWGSAGDSLRRARDPFFIRRILEEAGLPALEVRPYDAPPPTGEWLLKRRRSSGGLGVRLWTNDLRAEQDESFQQYAAGISLAAVFVADSAGTVLAGLTQQWTGLKSLGARPFAYCGSVGPVTIPDKVEAAVLDTGRAIARACGLRGLFGVDFVFDTRRAWPVEVNPRYTASVEVLELATGRPLLAEHSRAFGADVPLCGRRSSTPCVAKAVLFAPRGLCFRKSVESETGPWSVPELADVPADGTRIREGEPVCTLFGSGESPRAAIEHLSGRHARLCGSLGISNSSSHAILEEAFERGYHCLY